MTILKNGNVGIGTSSPDYKLELASGDIKSGADFITGEVGGVLNSGGALDANANVIGDAAAPNNQHATGDEDLFIEGKLEVVEGAYKMGGGFWSTISDQRLKTDIEAYNDGLQQLMQINLFSKTNAAQKSAPTNFTDRRRKR